ncbi:MULTISPECIES: transcriptional regulator [unclassified Streptomyces]|uniref:transcriptional regulator n=2 Tax=unclassified Streptomyces TaxID=2593676 RepID=UPI00224F91F3|nr:MULTISPECIES: transcriptional regulator [unclassified Streptomyces]MCX4788269.1 transcriptional regulator [Streptomyces sp. NBC_01221]WSJ37245.1 transcriptional regulator [Streptomyces sp. NBC_01321]WSP56528.1 transcriptional regulator [Streptomyces sp. NBC_01241]WSP63640.1 transcriptional regulator [Streptomyces sp. NBC_01240]
MPVEGGLSEAGFNELIHHPSRLAVMAFLSGCIEADFALVRDRCELSDSALSKIARTLEEAGYVVVRKGRVSRRARTWLSLTADGGDALAAHLDTLRAIATAARSAAHDADTGHHTA